MLRNPQTGETTIVLPPESGHGDTENFYHRVPARDTPTQELVIISHTHNPADTRSASADRQSQENNAPSVDDQTAMNDRGVAIQIVGPDVSGTLYRDDQGQDYFAVETGDISKVPDLSSQDVIVVDDREQR